MLRFLTREKGNTDGAHMEVLLSHLTLNGMLSKGAAKCQNMVLENRGSIVTLLSCEGPRVKI